MLEAMATLILVVVGATLVLCVMVYGIYITFYPLSKTVKGGMEAMKAQAKETEEKRLEKRLRGEKALKPRAGKKVLSQEE